MGERKSSTGRAQLAVAGTVRAAFKAVSQLSHHVQLPRRLIFILLPPPAPLSPSPASTVCSPGSS